MFFEGGYSQMSKKFWLFKDIEKIVSGVVERSCNRLDKMVYVKMRYGEGDVLDGLDPTTLRKVANPLKRKHRGRPPSKRVSGGKGHGMHGRGSVRNVTQQLFF
jgi:hypothetical protein